RTSYALTASGHELEEVVRALSEWGTAWAGRPTHDELDLQMLTRHIKLRLPIDCWPRARTVLAFRVCADDAADEWWWLMVADGIAEVCDHDPGREIAATIRTDLRTLTEVWRGDIPWTQAVKNGRLKIDARADVRRVVPQWLGLPCH